MRTSLEFMSAGDNFMNKTPIAQELRLTIKKYDLKNLKNVCEAKPTE